MKTMKNLRTKISLIVAMLLLTAAAATAQIEIRTAEDMAAIGNNRNSRKGSYILMNDLTLDNWKPINSFSGTFNGNGHTITLSVYAEQEKLREHNEVPNTACIGLFRFIDKVGWVMNLHVAGSIVSTNHNKSFTIIAVGGIVGCNHGKIVNCSSSVSLKCESTGQPYTGNIIPYFRSLLAGGIAGINNREIVNCYATGDIEVSGDANKMGGGIVGGNGYFLKNCYGTGAISVYGDKKGHIAGGITGRNVFGAIVNCVALNSRIDATETSKKSGVLKTNPNASYVADGLLGDHYSYPNLKQVKPANSYYRSDMVINIDISSDDERVEPDDIAVDPATMQQQEWWENSPKFAFGQTNDAPWIWDETQQRPILYWEKFEVVPMPLTRTYTLFVQPGSRAAQQAEAILAQAEAKAAKENATEGGVMPNIKWRIEDATLIVSGTGEIPGMPSWIGKISGVTSVIIEDGITKLGHHAFAAMNKNITSVILGKDLTEIGTYAFFNCNNLAVMEVRSATPPKTGAFAFMSTPVGKAKLIVPAGSRAAYLNNKTWKKFGTIEEQIMN